MGVPSWQIVGAEHLPVPEPSWGFSQRFYRASPVRDATERRAPTVPAGAEGLLDSDPKGAIDEKLAVGGREYEVAGISGEATGGGFAAQPSSSYTLIDDALALSGRRTAAR